MTKGQTAYELRAGDGFMTWAEIAARIDSTEEGARRVARHYAARRGLELPNHADERGQVALDVVRDADHTTWDRAVEDAARRLRVCREQVLVAARRVAERTGDGVAARVRVDCLATVDSPAAAYRMGVVERVPWAAVAAATGYRDGKSAQTIARSYATANGLHYPFTYRGPGRRMST